MASFEIRSSFHGNRAASTEPPCQLIEVQLRYYTRLLISHTPGLPLLEESSSSPTLHALFSLPLFNDSSSFQTHVVQSLASLNLRAAACDIIAFRITEFALQFLNSEFTQFSIVAYIDYIEIQCRDSLYVPQPIPTISGERFVDETLILELMTDVGASRLAIQKLRKRKFCGEEGECSVCCEEFGRKEVIRMGCGHVFHEGCIVRWLKKKNSCPLCRRPLED